MENVMNNLRKNNMEPYFVQTKEEVVPLLKKLIPSGATVTTGGSVTLNETGALDLLRSGGYNFLDRFAPNLSREDVEEIFRKAFFADVYLASANALTEKGEIYNVDGNSNRVAAILFGPKSVILVVGKNKIVPDIQAAAERVKRIAAPLNCKRLHVGSYCEKAGVCMSLKQENPDICDGCRGEGRICCSYAISGYQRQKNRIKVIIVNEDLGY